MLKANVFQNLSVNIILEIQKLFLDLDHAWHDCAWPEEETFQSSRSAKKFDVIWWRPKFFFALKSPKNHYFARLQGQSVAQSYLDYQQICYWNTWQLRSCIREVYNFWMILKQKPRGERSLISFWLLSLRFGHLLDNYNEKCLIKK